MGGTTKYCSCTEYWLDSQTGTFRGKFEEMYRDIEDPWGCEAGCSSLNNRIFLDVVFNDRSHYERILDVGCGLGGLLDTIRMRNGEGYVLGVDISQTAIHKAERRYPGIDFRCHDLLRDELPERNFDLVVLSEVLWYVLDDLPLFFERVSTMISSGGSLAIHQYFPVVQRFGRDRMDGLSGFLAFMEARPGLSRQHMVTSHHHDGLVLLSTFKKEK